MDAKQVADNTKERLANRGYCLWKCANLKGDVIAIVSHKGFRPNDFKGICYTEAELIEMCESGSFQMIHEARKLGFDITEGEE